MAANKSSDSITLQKNTVFWVLGTSLILGLFYGLAPKDLTVFSLLSKKTKTADFIYVKNDAVYKCDLMFTGKTTRNVKTVK